MPRPTCVLLPAAETCVATSIIAAVELGLLVAMLRASIVAAAAAGVVVVAVGPPTLLAATVARVVPVTWVAIINLVLLLLDENAVKFDVAVVHDEVLLHEALKVIAIDHIERTVLPETAHQVLHACLIRFPLFNVALDLHLGIAELFVELFEVSLRFNHQRLVYDIRQ